MPGINRGRWGLPQLARKLPPKFWYADVIFGQNTRCLNPSSPTREDQEIKRIAPVDWMWDECEVEMDSCVVRELKDGSGEQNDYERRGFATTRVALTVGDMIKIYELRPEIEEDHRQWKHGLWDIDSVWCQIPFRSAEKSTTPQKSSINCAIILSVIRNSFLLKCLRLLIISEEIPFFTEFLIPNSRWIGAKEAYTWRILQFL